jgi:hypothetical protein
MEDSWGRSGCGFVTIYDVDNSLLRIRYRVPYRRDDNAGWSTWYDRSIEHIYIYIYLIAIMSWRIYKNKHTHTHMIGRAQGHSFHIKHMHKVIMSSVWMRAWLIKKRYLSIYISRGVLMLALSHVKQVSPTSVFFEVPYP